MASRLHIGQRKQRVNTIHVCVARARRLGPASICFTVQHIRSEAKDEIEVKMDVPGMEQKDISISLSGDNLMIKG